MQEKLNHKKKKGLRMAGTNKVKSRKREEEYHFARYQTTIIASVTILLIVVLFILSRNGTAKQHPGMDDNDEGLSVISNRSLLATVNDEPIYMDEVSRLYSTLPPAEQTNETLQQAFDTVVNNKLLVQDARSRGITVSEADVNNTLNSIMRQSNLTDQILKDRLAAIGLTNTDFRNEIKETLILKLEIEYIWSMVQPPTEEHIRSYFDLNWQNITSIPKAKIRQLMITANSSNSKEKLEYIRTIAIELNITDFCILVSKYSEDRDSISRCGVYDFQKGELLPEFEDVVLIAPKGSIIIVPTRLGYHLVEVLERYPARQLSFEEARDAIGSQLLNAKRQTLLTNYINELRKKATIVSAQEN